MTLILATTVVQVVQVIVAAVAMAAIERSVNSVGITQYRLDGVFHNPIGPAMIWRNGEWGWWLNGLPHRYYGTQTSVGTWCVHGILLGRLTYIS